jgi:gentisate 1,2-dioxygenase
LWEVLHSLVQPEPVSPARVHRWSYDAARDYLMRAGDLISAEQAERRVLILKIPALLGNRQSCPASMRDCN